MRVSVIEKASGQLSEHIRELIGNGHTVHLLFSAMGEDRIIGEIKTFQPNEIHLGDTEIEADLLRNNFNCKIVLS